MTIEELKADVLFMHKVERLAKSVGKDAVWKDHGGDVIGVKFGNTSCFLYSGADLWESRWMLDTFIDGVHLGRCLATDEILAKMGAM